MLKCTLILTTVAAVLAMPAQAQQPGEISYEDISVMPSGMAGERIASLIATLNSGDAARIRRFIETEVTPEFRGIASMDDLLDFLIECSTRGP